MFYPSVINKTLNKPVKRKITKIIIYNDIFLVMINKEALATVKTVETAYTCIIKGILHEGTFTIRRTLETLRDQSSERRRSRLQRRSVIKHRVNSGCENSVQSSDLNSVKVSDRKERARGKAC